MCSQQICKHRIFIWLCSEKNYLEKMIGSYLDLLQTCTYMCIIFTVKYMYKNFPLIWVQPTDLQKPSINLALLERNNINFSFCNALYLFTLEKNISYYKKNWVGYMFYIKTPFKEIWVGDRKHFIEGISHRRKRRAFIYLGSNVYHQTAFAMWGVWGGLALKLWNGLIPDPNCLE